MLAVASTASAQTPQSNDAQTAKEEKEGQELWEKITKNELQCGELNDGQYEALGEFFMGRMLGSSHAQMNQQMAWMMGKEGEEAMHVALAKRLSGCDPNATMPASAQGGSMMPMMMGMMSGGMMGGNQGASSGGWVASNAPWSARGLGMMGGGPWPAAGLGMMSGAGWGWGGGWLMMLTWWVLLILVVLALLKYLKGSTRH